jgi:hypothetical protein
VKTSVLTLVAVVCQGRSNVIERELARRMVSSGMLRRVALDRTGVSEELSASFIGVTRIGVLGTTQAATSNRRTLRQVFGISSQSASVASCSLCS